MCAAALWCVQCRTDLRPQATGRRLLYTPGTSLKLAAEEALLPFTTIDCRRLNESVLSCNARRGSLPLTQPLQLTVCPAPTACFFAVHLSFFFPHVFQSITVASQTLQFSCLQIYTPSCPATALRWVSVHLLRSICCKVFDHRLL